MRSTVLVPYVRAGDMLSDAPGTTLSAIDGAAVAEAAFGSVVFAVISEAVTASEISVEPELTGVGTTGFASGIACPIAAGGTTAENDATASR